MSETTVLSTGTKVLFGSRIGEVCEYLPNGDARRRGPHYVVLPFDTGVGDGHGYTEVYPVSMVSPAPLDWSPVLGAPSFQQRWVRSGRIWQREFRKVEV